MAFFCRKIRIICVCCVLTLGMVSCEVYFGAVLNHPCESISEVKVFRVARGKVSCEFKCHCSAVLVLSIQRKQCSVFLLSRGKLALKNYLYLSIRHVSHSSFHVMNSVIKQTLLFNGNEWSWLPTPSAFFLLVTSFAQSLYAQNPRIFELECR